MTVTIVKLEPKKIGTYDLNQKQLQALPLFVAGKSGVEIAKIVGVNQATISGWINQHTEFQRALKIETEAVQDFARRILQAGAAKAARTLVETASSGQNSANKTKAAQLVLERAGVIDDPLTVSGVSPETAALVALIQQRRVNQNA